MTPRWLPLPHAGCGCEVLVLEAEVGVGASPSPSELLDVATDAGINLQDQELEDRIQHEEEEALFSPHVTRGITDKQQHVTEFSKRLDRLAKMDSGPALEAEIKKMQVDLSNITISSARSVSPICGLSMGWFGRSLRLIALSTRWLNRRRWMVWSTCTSGGISWRSAPSNFESHCRIPGGFHFSTNFRSLRGKGQGPSSRSPSRRQQRCRPRPHLFGRSTWFRCYCPPSSGISLPAFPDAKTHMLTTSIKSRHAAPPAPERAFSAAQGIDRVSASAGATAGA
jgi:hypothetical protein